MKRKINHREVNEVILLVCEGEKTEPTYFKHWKKKFHQARKNLVIDIRDSKDSKGTHPSNLIDFAIQEIKSNAYSKVICIFDIDERKGLENQLRRAEKKGVECCITNPSFEFWYLLHHKYTTAQLTASEATKRLENYIPGYTKKLDVKESLESLLGNAIRNATKIDKYHEQNNPDLPRSCKNPNTEVHRLNDFLESKLKE